MKIQLQELDPPFRLRVLRVEEDWTPPPLCSGWAAANSATLFDRRSGRPSDFSITVGLRSPTIPATDADPLTGFGITVDVESAIVSESEDNEDIDDIDPFLACSDRFEGGETAVFVASIEVKPSGLTVVGTSLKGNLSTSIAAASKGKRA